nr:hypothetical protein Q903MT_gene2962 [Picea sitchensis]
MRRNGASPGSYFSSSERNNISSQRDDLHATPHSTHKLDWTASSIHFIRVPVRGGIVIDLLMLRRLKGKFVPFFRSPLRGKGGGGLISSHHFVRAPVTPSPHFSLDLSFRG